MKTLIKILALVLFISSCTVQEAYYEDRYYDPPSWANNYHAGIYYYYFPNYGMYYYVPASQWVYYNGIYWVYSYDRPYWCSGVNLHYSYYVPLSYTGTRPYHYHSSHVTSYPPRELNVYYGPRKNLPSDMQDRLPARDQRDENIRREPINNSESVKKQKSQPRNTIQRKKITPSPKKAPTKRDAVKQKRSTPPKRIQKPPTRQQKRITPPSRSQPQRQRINQNNQRRRSL